MENYHYEPIHTHLEQQNKLKPNSWLPFLRQLFICSGAWTTLFISGLGMGAPTILIAQWRKEAKSEDAISEEMSSFLTCAALFCAPLWAILWTILTKHIGRRIPFAIAYLIMLIGFIVYYFSTTLTHLLISEVLKGSGYAANLSVTVLLITEYASPKYRGFFLTVKAASIYWGMWVSNAIGTFFHWKYIGISAFICYVYVATLVFWPESPLWLANEGRFDECAKNHRWLKGTGEDSEKELKKLIETHGENFKGVKKKNTIKLCFLEFVKIAKQSYFYKPLLISSLVTSQYVLSGKLSSSLYALEFIRKMTKDETSMYTIMLILDGVTVAGMYCGCFISRYVKRRTHIIWTSITTVCFLFTMSIYFYLIRFEIIRENDIVIACLLTAFSVSVASGPMILTYTIFGELIPTESRTAYTIVSVVTHFVFTSTYLKTAPYVFNRLSMQVTFFIYGLSSSIMTVLIYIYLPETKDKTLSEIESNFRKPENLLERPVERRTDLLDSVE